VLELEFSRSRLCLVFERKPIHRPMLPFTESWRVSPHAIAAHDGGMARFKFLTFDDVKAVLENSGSRLWIIHWKQV
jgi:hypothetical protein